VLLAIATFVLHAINFARPYWTPLRSWMRIGLNVGSLVVLATLLNSGTFVLAAASSNGHQADLARLTAVINMSTTIGLVVAFIVTVIEIGRDVYRISHRNWTNSTPEPSMREAR
jgi:hypothetical protein